MLFDAPASLEPIDVLNWLDVCNAGLDCEERDAHQLLQKDLELPSHLVDALGVAASRKDLDEYFVASRRELELSAVFTLIAAAEARVRQDAALRMKANGDDLANRLRLLLSNANMEWTIPLYEGGILDEWKRYIGSLTDLLRLDQARLLSAIGRFKNLLNIRHWVAHGRYWELKWNIEHFSPSGAAEIIAELYESLRKVAEHGSLISFA
jgi:hypothetical protein